MSSPITPVSGPVALLKVGSLVAAAMNWKLNIDPKLVDISNFQSGRTPAFTLTDVDIEFTLVWDQTNPVTDSDRLFLVDGATFYALNATNPVYTAQCYTAAGKFFQLSFMIASLAPAVESLEDVLKMPVTGKINGTLTYPTNLS